MASWHLKHSAYGPTPLDTLCPLHVKMDDRGSITHVGPTMAKLRQESFIGRPFWHQFELIRPKKILSVKDVQELSGSRIHMRFRQPPHTPFKGEVAIGFKSIIANLSFGYGIVEAIQEYNLTDADFSGADLTIEMLYLLEAKSAAFSEAHWLNKKLLMAKSEAEAKAMTDQLTGLKNRRALNAVLANMVAGAVPFACMHLDLDYFKSVNDTLGHAAGDLVLQNVAKVLRENTRANDCVARVGGDEFVLLFDGITERAELDRIARRIISQLEVPVAYEGQLCRISGSAGTTISTSYPKLVADDLLNDADTALYASKAAGRGRHTFFDRRLNGALH